MADLFAGMSDEESIRFQAEQWLEGRPFHNTVRDECCPDFSCCVPTLLVSREKREMFLAAENENAGKMGASFLKALLENEGRSVRKSETSRKEG